MGVNSTGLNQTPKQINQVNRAQAAQAKENTASQATARTAALANANALGNAPASTPVVTVATVAPGVAAASTTGGTTAPAGRVNITATAPRAANVAAQVALATGGVFQAFQSLASIAVATNRTKVSSISGDDKENTGDVKKTESEEKNQLALKDANSETGNDSGDISGANSASGPST